MVKPKTTVKPVAKAAEEKPVVALAKSPGAEVSTEVMDDTGPLDFSDVIIPRILCMQGLSKFVADEKGRAGEFRESLEARLLGGKDKPVHFIPLTSNKTWVIFSVDKGTEKYHSTVPVTADNHTWQREEVVNGMMLRRYQSLNYFVLLPDEIAKGEAFPYLLSFRSTSYTTGGKPIETWKFRLRGLPVKKTVADFAWTLSCSQKENAKGKFYVMHSAKDRDITPKEREAVLFWHKLVSTASIKVDTEDAADIAAEAGATGKDEDAVY